MLHGTGVAVARRAKSEGSVVNTEPVNQHIEAALAIVEEERETLGLKQMGGPIPLSYARWRRPQRRIFCSRCHGSCATRS